MTCKFASFLCSLVFLSMTGFAREGVPNIQGILDELARGSDGKTPTVKNFDAAWVASLDQRGEPTVYTRENSANFEYIGMPVGGIGAGLLYLGGDGKLWGWDIFNTKGSGQTRQDNGFTSPYARSETNNPAYYPLVQGFAVRLDRDGGPITRTLDRDGFKDIRFRGQYPIGYVSYADADCPVTVELEAFSPFCPLNLDDSALPATVMQYKVKNASKQVVSGDLVGWLQNAVCIDSGKKRPESLLRRNRLTGANESSLLEFSAEVSRDADNTTEAWMKGNVDYGSMALLLMDKAAVARGMVDFQAPGGELDPKATGVARSCGSPAPVGALARAFSLKPGEEITVRFVLAWYFPNYKGIGLRTTTERSYGPRFSSARGVAEYVATRFDTLAGQTRQWHDTWYDSTLPWWFLDRTFLNTCILASNTSYLFSDGRFFGYEGEHLGYGTCTHVWGYSQAIGWLFPQIERSLREIVDYNPKVGFDAKTGGIGQRAELCLDPADDGQCSIIIRTLLVHRMQPDNKFLAGIYPQMKQAMNFLVNDQDPKREGIMTKDQMNTLDARWYGKIAWLSLYYGVALRSAAEMADVMNDPAAATEWRAIADRGRKYIEEKLFNGEYFIQDPDPAHPDSPGSFTGCMVDQLLGQSWAYQVGLGRIIDPEKTRKALECLWRYNLTTDVGPYREKFRNGRWFAKAGDGGFLMCSWPNGGTEAMKRGGQLFAGYMNECMSGFEYALSSVMMRDGMPFRSLAHTRIMNERYAAARHNPWNEVEYGSFYARAMASYGVFTAACGFEYDGPKGYIGFSPQLTPANFRAAFTAAEGWGTYEQRIGDDRARTSNCRIALKYGRLKVKSVSLGVVAEMKPRSAKLKIKGCAVDCTLKSENGRCIITLAEDVTLSAGDTLEIVLKHKR